MNTLRVKNKPIHVLTIGGSDTSGGAGIQADIKNFQEQGVYGLSVVTAVTAQDQHGVAASLSLPVEIIQAQLRACASYKPAAVKIGMLAVGESVTAVAEFLRQKQLGKIILDPVLKSHHGRELLDAEAVDVLLRELVPLAYLLTPNIDEAEALLDMRIETLAAAETAAGKLRSLGAENVLIKGGHLNGDADDLLLWRDRVKIFKGKRIKNVEVHGTGCLTAAVITAETAKGSSLPEAVARAKAVVTEKIRQVDAAGGGLKLFY